MVTPVYGLGAVPLTPDEPQAKRAALLEAVESVRPVIEATAARTEADRTLAPEAVEAFREAGLFALKLPRELGGAEADPIVQMDVIEAVTLIDPSSAWTMFISGAVVGSTSARLPDEGIEELFAGGRIPCFAGTLKPDGRAVRVEGGYRISGHWGWGSGIRHADYVNVLSPTDNSVIAAAVPIAEVDIHDNWHVVGLRGTGRCDYSLDDVFVPDRRVADIRNPPQYRGGALYRMGVPGYVVNEHMIFALAVARLALDALQSLATAKKRGYGAGTTIADRPSVQRLVSEGRLRLAACRLLCDDVLGRLFDSCADGPPDPAVLAEARAVGTLCTDEAVAIVSGAFRHAGGTAVYDGSMFERCLRDLYTVQSHFVVSDTAYEQHGQLLLGVDDRPSMS